MPWSVHSNMAYSDGLSRQRTSSSCSDTAILQMEEPAIEPGWGPSACNTRSLPWRWRKAAELLVPRCAWVALLPPFELNGPYSCGWGLGLYKIRALEVKLWNPPWLSWSTNRSFHRNRILLVRSCTYTCIYIYIKIHFFAIFFLKTHKTHISGRSQVGPNFLWLIQQNGCQVAYNLPVLTFNAGEHIPIYVYLYSINTV